MKIAAAAALSLCAAGCSSWPSADTGQVIAEYDVVNAVKCQVQTFLDREKAGKRFYVLSPAYAVKAEITLKTASATTTEGSVSAIIPLGGASLAPALSLTATKSKTITGTTVFLIQQKEDGARAKCPQLADQPDIAGIRFADWLTTKFESERQLIAGAPRIGLGEISLETQFGVTVGAKGSTSLVFVPLTASAGIARTQEDVQSLKLTFYGYHAVQPPSFKPGALAIKGRKGGGPGNDHMYMQKLKIAPDLLIQ